MRHKRNRHKLSRDSAHRKSLMKNLSRQLIEHERIQTSQAKAKAVKPEVERMITIAKRGDLHSRRLLLSRLGQDKFIVHKLVDEIAPRYSERPGGYTRIVKLGPRRSDSTEMVYLNWSERVARWRPVGSTLPTTARGSGAGRGNRGCGRSRASSRTRSRR